MTGGLGNDFATDEKLANEMLDLPRENLDVVVTRVLRDGPSLSKCVPELVFGSLKTFST